VLGAFQGPGHSISPNLEPFNVKVVFSPAPTVRVALAVALAACATAQAAEQPTVEKCTKEMGTLAVVEPQDHMVAGLKRYGLGSPAIMLRLLIEESGCFAVVERGVAMQNLQQERSLASSGQLQGDANIGGGQMVGADFVMTPAVQFSGENGGMGGMVGGLLGRAGGLLGALGGLAGGVSFKEAETSLVVADVRSSLQVASAEGKASKMDFSLGGWGWGGLGWAAGGGYSKTPEGKLIAASLLDNFNTIVQKIRNKPTLIRNNSAAAIHNAAIATRATTSAPAAPAPAAPAAEPRPAPQGPGSVALPAGLSGSFSGQFSGGEQGMLMVVVGPTGQLTGIGQSASAGNLTVAGMVMPNGMVMMGAASQDKKLSAQFQGFINPGTGELIGTWRTENGAAQGTFNGKRQ
jgi:curli biogenesis system outer membrane secretion channel CsgG